MKILQMPKKLMTIIFLSLIATFNATYLTFSAFNIKAQKAFSFWGETTSSFCDLNSTFSCSSVFTHDFSWMFWIPFSLIAMIVYPLIIAIAVMWFFGVIKNHYKILFLLAIWGLLFNSYIIVNEVFVSTYCLLCLMCTLIIISVWILAKAGMCDEMKKKEKKWIMGKIKWFFSKK